VRGGTQEGEVGGRGEEGKKGRGEERETSEIEQSFQQMCGCSFDLDISLKSG